MIKKIINTTLAFSIIAGAGLGFTTSADAASITHSNPKGFTSAWTANDSGNGWLIKYGYNTTLINEDFTHTTHNSKLSYAIVDNANGKSSSSASSGNWAKTEVRHSGTSIKYIIQY